MMKGNPRINGYVSSPSCRSPTSSKHTKSLPSLFTTLKNNVVNNHDTVNGSNSKLHGNAATIDYKVLGNIKVEDEGNEHSKNHLFPNSIIGKSNIKKCIKPQIRKRTIRSTHHETLQRIDCTLELYNHYQQHWFSSGLERLKVEEMSREERLEITRYELHRHLNQIVKSEVGTECILPLSPATTTTTSQQQQRRPSVVSSPPSPPLTSSSITTTTNNSTTVTTTANSNSVIATDLRQSAQNANVALTATVGRLRTCEMAGCDRPALPCARHCPAHIMHNSDQVLFNYCTAKFADNTQCSVPVFDIMHELPLCVEHARKRDNYKLNQETKPKKLRKKVKPSAMIRPQKRNKKKKKRSPCASPDKIVSVKHQEILTESNLSGTDSEDFDQVLALPEPDLELTTVDQVLVSQATHLLEETDITNVLNTIHADEFNDLFSAVNRNGEYEPTREETEELERALAAVDNDVKSLEKLTQSQGLLDSFLDEHTLVESLVQIPDVFHHNGGATVTSGGYVTSAGSLHNSGATARLLSVQQHQ